MTQNQLDQLLLEAEKFPLPVRIAQALLQEHGYLTALAMLRRGTVHAEAPEPLLIAVENALRDLERTRNADNRDADRRRILGYALRRYLPGAPAPEPQPPAPRKAK